MKKSKAWVHSIETCGTVDGPGLRYVAFFQGCPLRCKYCHNPDTWKIISGQEMTADELINDVLRYSSYMNFSGGGFTASGGEPLLQAEFMCELFRRLKSHGIHTAIDTSGCRQAPEELLAFTDLVLLDIKSINPDRYRDLTGMELAPTLSFAEELNQRQIPVWIRYVIVPGLTDSPEDARALAVRLTDFSNVERVELLPFHKIGEYKWESLGLTCPLKDTPVPSDETLESLKSIFVNHGFDTR